MKDPYLKAGKICDAIDISILDDMVIRPTGGFEQVKVLNFLRTICIHCDLLQKELLKRGATGTLL